MWFHLHGLPVKVYRINKEPKAGRGLTGSLRTPQIGKWERVTPAMSGQPVRSVMANPDRLSRMKSANAKRGAGVISVGAMHHRYKVADMLGREQGATPAQRSHATNL